MPPPRRGRGRGRGSASVAPSGGNHLGHEDADSWSDVFRDRGGAGPSHDVRGSGSHGLGSDRGRSEDRGSDTAEDLHTATFTWPSTDAETVILAATLGNWSQSVSLSKTEIGFTGTIQIPWGCEIQYKYVVDGIWQPCPTQPITLDGSNDNVYNAPASPSPDAEAEYEVQSEGSDAGYGEDQVDLGEGSCDCGRFDIGNFHSRGWGGRGCGYYRGFRGRESGLFTPRFTPQILAPVYVPSPVEATGGPNPQIAAEVTTVG